MNSATRIRPSTVCWSSPDSWLPTVSVATRSGSRKNRPMPRTAVMPSMSAMLPRPISTPSSSACSPADRMSQRVPTMRVS